MLYSLRIANFRAFRDPAELTLRRDGRLRRQPVEAPWEPTVSTVAAIYGANASGKSTVIDAVARLREAVDLSYRHWPPGSSTNAQPFLLDDVAAAEPVELEIEFRADDGVDYQYGYRMTSEVVESEWLYAYFSSRRSTMFERGLETSSDPIRFGPGFSGRKLPLLDAARDRPNALTLSVAAQLGHREAQAPWLWIHNRLRFYEAAAFEQGHSAVIDLITERNGFKGVLTSAIASADVGVCDIGVTRSPLPESLLVQLDAMADRDPSFDREAVLGELERDLGRQLELMHTTSSGQRPLPFDLESRGTKALLSFLVVAILALEDGGTILVDELDSSLHPLLVQDLVAVFADPATNPRQAQLVFTTHDASLLNPGPRHPDLLSRDQVWRTEKDPSGNATLVAFSEYRPRSEENLQRRYLTGRFGGVPQGAFTIAAQSLADDPAPTDPVHV